MPSPTAARRHTDTELVIDALGFLQDQPGLGGPVRDRVLELTTDLRSGELTLAHCADDECSLGHGARLLFLDVEAGDFTYDGQGDLRLPASTPAHFVRLFDDLEVDGSSCASCEAAIGYVLDETDDCRPVGRWRWTTLVWDEGRRIGWAVCEDCACALDPMVSRLLADDRELPRVDAVAVAAGS